MGRKGIFLGVILFSVYNAFCCKPQINWAPSVSFCQGNSFTLNAYNTSSTYLWSTGATTSTLTVTSGGTYWVTVTNSCGSTSDTIDVYVDGDPGLNLGADREVCLSNNPLLTAPYSPSFTYEWQNGSTSNQMSVTAPGTYWVKVTNSCGTFRDTVNITLTNPPVVNLGPDQWNCNGAPVSLNVSSTAGGSVFWSNGNTSAGITITQGGIYWVKVQNICGIFSDTVKIYRSQGPYLNLGDTIGKCPSSPVTITPGLTGLVGGSFLWSTGATTSSVSVNSPGTYWLKYTEPCGTFYDTVVVVNSSQVMVDLGADTLVCESDDFWLDAGNSGNTYYWSSGDTSRTVYIQNQGTYWVGVSNGCSIAYDTINVTFKPIPEPIIADTVYRCTGDTVSVDAGQWGLYTGYLWDDGTKVQKHVYNADGAHWVKVYNDCDTALRNFYIKGLQPLSLSLGPDTIVCDIEYTIESHLPDWGNVFQWSNGSDTNFSVVNQTGTYWLKVSNRCGDVYDTIHVTLPPRPDILGPKPRTICGSTPVVLQSTYYPDVKYLWSTGDTTVSITVSSPGIYSLVTYNGCDSITDQVKVNYVGNVNLELGNDTSFCAPDVLYLDISDQPADSIQWSTGSHNGGLPVSTSGTYWVQIFNACGVFSDTIQITIRQPPQKKLKTQRICLDDSIILDVSQSAANDFLWNTGQTTPFITVSSQGWYKVRIANDCDTILDSAYIYVDAPLPPVSLGNDTVFCEGTLVLDPGNFPGANYAWSNNSWGKTLTVTQSGTYFVGIANACNTVWDTINVLITGPPKLVLGDRVKFCTGSIFTLNAKNPGSTYLWNTGDTTQYLPVDSAGLFWCTITNDCGQLTDTIELYLENPMEELELGNDTSICEGQSLILRTGYPEATTLWNTGSTDSVIAVTETGTYTVAISNTCGEWVDTIFVRVLDIPVFSLGNDTVMCGINGELELTGPAGMKNYLWSNGDNGLTTSFYQGGKKWLTIHNGCFSYTDTIFIDEDFPININLGPDTVLCHGTSLYLSHEIVNYPAVWSNNSTDPFIEVTRSGTYYLTAQNTCGIFSDTINVKFDYPLDPPISDTLICDGDSAIFGLKNNSTYSIKWKDGSTESVRSFFDEGSYFADIINRCGTFAKEFRVDISFCDCPFFIPNAFTPNGDGKNDFFRIGHSCDFTFYELKIFNRWGELIFRATDPNDSWNGGNLPKISPMGVYNYILNYSWKVYGVDRGAQKRGTLTLFR